MSALATNCFSSQHAVVGVMSHACAVRAERLAEGIHEDVVCVCCKYRRHFVRWLSVVASSLI
jgi:hypothetical protein